MNINPLMVKEIQKIYCKLAKIKNKEGDYTLSVINWIKKMKSELNNNSPENVAKINNISLKLVEKLDKIPSIYLEYL
jgi:hypothetical protein